MNSCLSTKTNQSLHERRIFPNKSVTGGDFTFWTGTLPCNLPPLAHLNLQTLTYTHSHCFLINIRTDWWEVPLDCLSQNQIKMKLSSGQTQFLGASCKYPHSFQLWFSIACFHLLVCLFYILVQSTSQLSLQFWNT